MLSQWYVGSCGEALVCGQPCQWSRISLDHCSCVRLKSYADFAVPVPCLVAQVCGLCCLHNALWLSLYLYLLVATRAICSLSVTGMQLTSRMCGLNGKMNIWQLLKIISCFFVNFTLLCYCAYVLRKTDLLTVIYENK